MEAQELEAIEAYFKLKSEYYNKYFEIYKHQRDKDLSDFYNIASSEIKERAYNSSYKSGGLKEFLKK